MQLYLHLHEDVGAFLNAAGFLLRQKEAQNCLILGLTSLLSRQPLLEHRLTTVHDDTSAIGAACVLGKGPLLLTDLPTEAVDLVVSDALTFPDCIPGIVGPMPTIEEFKAAWVAQRHCSIISVMKQRFFQLERVSEHEGVMGALRLAMEADRSLLEGWSRAFNLESGLGGDMNATAASTERALRVGTRYLWEVAGEPAAMVGFTCETPSGVGIDWVYTPPALRGRGYATAAVAALSQRLLANGKAFCFLATDLANPTSNSIYERIGYRPVCDVTRYAFRSHVV